MTGAEATLRVMLVDDHPIVRDGLRLVIERIPGAKVVSEAASGEAALALIATQRPDLVLMDIGMADMDGIEATSRIKGEWPAMRVLVMSAHSGRDVVLRALKAGADGYLLKDSGITEVTAALAAVCRGDTYLSPGISKHVISGMLESAEAAPGPLTPRQSEILRMIALGMSTKEIAFSLGLSTKTVETHRARTMERLGIHDLAGLVLYAVRSGLIELDRPREGEA